MITGKPSARISDFVTYPSALFGNRVTVICPPIPNNGQDKSALAFYNEGIDSSVSIFKAPEDTISGATPSFMVCPLEFK